MENFQDRVAWVRDLDPVLKKFMDAYPLYPDPVCPERLDPDPVCPERLDPDPVNIRPDPKPCLSEHLLIPVC